MKDIESAKRIISNPTYKKTGEFTPDCLIIDRFDLANKVVVDFGCGIGRNSRYILSKNPLKLICYDFPNMIKLAREYIGESEIEFIEYPITNLLEVRKVDFILADIVLQHISATELRHSVLPALNELLSPNGSLLVNSRGYTDDNHNVWKIICEHFKPADPLLLEDWSALHQAGEFKPR